MSHHIRDFGRYRVVRRRDGKSGLPGIFTRRTDFRHQCKPILSKAGLGIENARNTCGIWWVDPTVLGSEPGFMPNTPGRDTALIMINSQLQPPAGGVGGQMPDPHPSAQPGDSVGTGEVVTHEGLHASFDPTYFGRGLLNLAWETAAGNDAAMCASLVDYTVLFDVRRTGAVASPPERAGLQGVVLAAIIVGIAGGWGAVRRRRVVVGWTPWRPRRGPWQSVQKSLFPLPGGFGCRGSFSFGLTPPRLPRNPRSR